MSQTRSIKYNFILNWMNTLLGIIFPIITFPYIARIIGPVGLGIISFDTSILNYITILSSLGIGLYAVREISRLRDNIDLQNHRTVEILLLHILLTLLGYIAVFALYLFIPEINVHGAIFLILSISIFFKAIGVMWYFQAREDFLFITVRSLFVKMLSAIALFMFVRTSDDLIIYAIILAMADVANNMLNFIRLNRYITYRKIRWRDLHIFSHLRPAAVIFAMGLIINMYIDLPTIFLGFECSEENVGFYTTSTRLVTVIMSFVTALGTSMLPRMSYYTSTGDTDKFKELENKGMTFTIGVTLPISIALIIISPELVLSFSGKQFVESISVLRIIAPTILFTGIASIAGLQTLYPQGHEHVIIRSALVGLLVSIVINLSLVGHMAQQGAAISFLCAELSVTVSMIIFGHRHLSYRYINPSTIRFALASAIMALILIAIHNIPELNKFVRLGIEIISGITAYATILYLTREIMFRSLLDSLKATCNRIISRPTK